MIFLDFKSKFIFNISDDIVYNIIEVRNMTKFNAATIL
jgi:hypothetical protein